MVALAEEMAPGRFQWPWPREWHGGALLVALAKEMAPGALLALLVALAGEMAPGAFFVAEAVENGTRIDKMRLPFLVMAEKTMPVGPKSEDSEHREYAWRFFIAIGMKSDSFLILPVTK